jgi:hypothetical protein
MLTGSASRRSPSWPSRLSGHPDHAVRRAVRVRVRCPPCGRTSVQLVERTSGVQASGVQASGVHTTGVIRVSGQTRASGVRGLGSRAVRTALDPRRRRRGGTGHVGAPGWTCRCGTRAAWSSLPNRPGGEGMVVRWQCVAGTRVEGRPGRCSACVQAAAPRSPPGRPWEPVQRQVPVGWLGSTGGAGAHKSPAGASWAGCRRDARPWAGPGGGDHAAWSLKLVLVP